MTQAWRVEISSWQFTLGENLITGTKAFWMNPLNDSWNHVKLHKDLQLDHIIGHVCVSNSHFSSHSSACKHIWNRCISEHKLYDWCNYQALATHSVSVQNWNDR